MARQHGFTLVELMVTITIVAILAMMAAPAFTSTIAAQRIRGLAVDLHQGLLKARSEAIKRNTSVTVNPINGDWSQGWAIADPTNPSGPPLDQRSANSAVSVATSLTQITYTGSGRISGTTTPTFVLSAASTSESRCVSIDPSGRPYGVKGATC